ncbi:MAG: biotin/lipoate A/B protein ligase family protein [Methanomassiliicoccales archaeon]|jgi:lipoate-protein ligase A
MAWRVVDLGSMSPALTAAVDEAILTFRSKGSVGNTLSFYSRDRPTISLGYFEKASECIDLELCHDLGIDVVRRLSGGSAIFTDPGQIIYTVTVEAGVVPENPRESYPLICSGVVNALKSLGIEAEHKPLNDVVVNGRKISGSAQTRKAGVVLQHGTVVIDSDLETMMRVIRQRPGKPRNRDGMTSVSLELGRPVNMFEVKTALIAGFERTFGVRIENGTLSAEEHALARKLSEEKYGKEVFTFQR